MSDSESALRLNAGRIQEAGRMHILFIPHHFHSIYTIYTKVCGQPIKIVDWAISATPIADRSIKSSTQPCNLHRQTSTIE